MRSPKPDNRQLKLTPPESAPLNAVGSYVFYPVGKLLLRIITVGSYPPEDRKHNSVFVAIFPWFVVILGFLIVDEWAAIKPLIFGN